MAEIKKRTLSYKQIINNAIKKDENLNHKSVPSYQTLLKSKHHQIALNYLAEVSNPNKKLVSQREFCKSHKISHNTLRNNLIYLTGKAVKPINKQSPMLNQGDLDKNMTHSDTFRHNNKKKNDDLNNFTKI